jgi:hypothetical protein
MKLGLYKTSILATFSVVFFISCATKKDYLVTVNQLNSTEKRLDSAVQRNDALQKEMALQKITAEMKLKESHADARNREYRIYRNAVSCYDYPLAAIQLARLSEIDTPNRAVYYDSLAFIHFFFLMDPSTARANNAAYFYTKKGLAMNPKNEFLLEIKGKLDLEEHRDSMALNIFNRLYAKTGDYTYLYESTFVQLAIYNNVRFTDSVIDMVIRKIDSEIKTVRLDYLQEKFQQQIPAKAAFLYLRAVIQNGVQGNKIKAMKTLEQILKIAPDYYYAKGMLSQLKNPQAANQGRPY